MIRRTRRFIRLLAEIAIGLVIGVMLITGFIAWRLTEEGAISLSFLVPSLQQSLSPKESPVQFSITDAALVWDEQRRDVDLRARGVTMTAQDGGRIASIPELSFRLSPRALLTGHIAPSGIAAIGPKVHITRFKDGRWGLGQDSTTPQSNDAIHIETPAEGYQSALTAFVAILRHPEDLPPSARYLSELGLLSGEITVTDEQSGRSWQASRVDLTVVRVKRGVEAQFQGEIEDLGRPALASGHLRYEDGADRITLSARLDNLVIQDMAILLPELGIGGDSALSMNMVVAGTWPLSPQAPAPDLEFSAISPAGSLILPELFDRPLPIGSMNLHGAWHGATASLEIDSATLSVGKAQLGGVMTVQPFDPRVEPPVQRAIAGTVTAEEVHLEDLPILWPKNIVAGGRSWVNENIPSGTIRDATVGFSFLLDHATGQMSQVTADGKARIENATVHYLRPLAPAEQATGQLTFNQSSLTAELTSPAKVKDIAVDQMTVVIDGFDHADQTISADGGFNGPLPTILSLLDNDRFALVRKLDIDPATAKGDAAAHIHVKFPAVNDLEFKQIDLSADAKIDQASLQKIFLQRDLSDGKLSLSVDKKQMQVTGDAIFGGVPVTLDWLQYYAAKDDGEVSRIAVEGRPNTDQMAAAGFEFRPYVSGDAGTELLYRRYQDGRELIDGKFNLTTATITIDELRWNKPPGREASGSMTLELKNGKPVFIQQMELQGDGLRAIGTGRFADGNGQLSKLYFSKLALGQTDLREVTLDLQPDHTSVRVGSGTFDASPYLTGSPLFDKNVAKPDTETMRRPYSIEAPGLARLILGKDREIQDAVLSLEHDGQYWDRIRLNAVLPGGAPMHVSYEPVAGKNQHHLSMLAEDAGAAFKALDILSSVSEGRLTIEGNSDDTDPDRPINATIEMEDFRLKENSLVIRLLSIATLTAVLDELTGEGYAFDRLQADLVKRGERIDIDKLRARGPSLGFTASGWVDYGINQLKLSGELVPAYFFNSLIGNIPLLGPIIIGGEGEGLFAISYSADGALDDPNFSTNPLSVLTPGFLRDIFDLTPGQSSTSGGEQPPKQENDK